MTTLEDRLGINPQLFFKQQNNPFIFTKRTELQHFIDADILNGPLETKDFYAHAKYMWPPWAWSEEACSRTDRGKCLKKVVEYAKNASYPVILITNSSWGEYGAHYTIEFYDVKLEI